MDPETLALVGHIRESGRRMSQFLEDLLSYARLSQSTFKHAGATEAHPACLGAIDSLRVTIQESEACIAEEIADNVLVKMEPSILAQIFQT